MRTRLSDAKDPDQCNIAQLVNVSPDDPRFTAYVNRCQRELVMTGEHFWGLFARYTMCVDNQCITWPRQFASIETAAVCDQPIQVRNQWFEFLESGAGIASDGTCNTGTGNRRFCGALQLYDRGTVCTFADIIASGNPKKIKVYADVSEDADAKILLQGNDINGNWVRTEVAGEWVDGEYVSISTTPQTSVTEFTSLVAVQKPVTNGTVRLYEYDTVLTTQRALAVYEPDETNPSYRRSFIGGWNNHGCCGSNSECEQKKVTVMAKLEFIPAKRDNDWLLIGNLSALEAEAQAVLKSDANIFAESAAWHLKALTILRNELRHYSGSPVVPIRMQPRRVGGAGVLNIV